MVMPDLYPEASDIGIVAHSYEGGSLCFQATCREGAAHLGPHMHPNVHLSCIPMGLSMPAWESDDYREISHHLLDGIQQVARSGADFFICPDNTAHIVLEQCIDQSPIPGLHIADVVCSEIINAGWKTVALLGTEWTMTGPVYSKILEEQNIKVLVPEKQTRLDIDRAIFDELCQGIFKPETIALFIDAIQSLKDQGAECVILGCTEIPLIVNPDNSPLPALDSTRLLARYAVKTALSGKVFNQRGWIR